MVSAGSRRRAEHVQGEMGRSREEGEHMEGEMWGGAGARAERIGRRDVGRSREELGTEHCSTGL